MTIINPFRFGSGGATLTHEAHQTFGTQTSGTTRTITFNSVPSTPTSGQRVYLVVVALRDALSNDADNFNYLRVNSNNPDTGTLLITPHVTTSPLMAVASAVYTINDSGSVDVEFQTVNTHNGGFTVSIYVFDEVSSYVRDVTEADFATGTVSLTLSLSPGGDGMFSAWICAIQNGAGTASVFASDYTYSSDIGFDVGTSEYVTVQSAGIVTPGTTNPGLSVETNDSGEEAALQHIGLSFN